MNNWSVLVHRAEARRYRPGEEDTTRRVLSSVHADAGIVELIDEPQHAATAGRVRRSRLPARLLAWVRGVAVPVPAGIAERPQALPGEARR